jgi:hypothetical protein
MISISQQVKVIKTLTKQASEAPDIHRATEVLITRELALKGLLRDLRGDQHLVGVFPSHTFEVLGGKR